MTDTQNLAAAADRAMNPIALQRHFIDGRLQMQGLAARAAENFEYYARAVTELCGRSFQVGDEMTSYTICKPVGVAGLIMPWNAQLMLSTWRTAPALAAGNTIVLKPSEWSPLTATRLSELISEAGVPDGVFNMVQGIGETAGAPLSRHSGFDPITELGPLIHHARVSGCIESAREQGATIHAGGGRPPQLPDGNFLEAT